MSAFALAVHADDNAAVDNAFDVFEYRVEGATLLPTILVERAVYPHMGEARTLSDVEAAREALERAYHAAGYLTALVAIPPQKVEGGVVRLAVTEAPVSRLRVVESRYYSLGQIKAAVPELAEGNVPHFPTMQKELVALGRSPDRKIAPVLRPGKTPGTVEVDLKVKDELPLHGNVEVNDRYSQDTTRTRINFNARWDNLWQRQHGFGISLQTAPEDTDESRVVSLSYTWPLASGDYLAFYAVSSESDVAAVGTLNVLGNGVIAGARYIKPLRGDSGFFHSATLGVDYKDFDQTVNLLGGDDLNAPIAYLPFTLGWDGTWAGEGTRTRVGAAFNFHLRGLVADEQEFADKRFKGRANYAYLRGNVSHERALFGDWRLDAKLGWQLAAQPLISNEQFAIGGADTVRAYVESAALGDNGAVLNFTLSTPNLASRLGLGLRELRLAGFADAGHVTVRAPITATDRFTLASVGVGLRAKAAFGLYADLDWAVALRERGDTQDGDTRAHFRLGTNW